MPERPELRAAGGRCLGLFMQRPPRREQHRGLWRYRLTTADKLTDIGPPASVGIRWRHSYDRRVDFIQGGGEIGATVYRPDGKVYYFKQVGDPDLRASLQQLLDGASNPIGWEYTDQNDTVETFDVAGKVTAIRSRSGQTLSISYDTGGRLSAVSDAFGHTLTFTYANAKSVLIVKMTDPAGGEYLYDYDTYNRLSSVTYPDGTVKTYHWSETGGGITSKVHHLGAR